MPPAPVDNLQTYFADPAKWEQATRALQSVARAIVGDQDSAEDIVQGAWVEAMQRPAKAFGLGWLRALVRSRSIDALRRKRMEPLPGEVPTDSSPEPAMWKLQAQQDVLAAVQSLKEPYRSTVFLRYFEGLGPKEIAAQSNVPEKTVKTRLTRAHAILRDRLGPGMGNKEGSWSPALIGFAALPSPTLPTATAALTPVVPLFAMKKIALIAAGLLVGLFSYSALSSKPSELGDTEPKTDAPAILAMDQGGAADLVEPPKPDRKTAALAVTEPVAKEPVGTAGTGSLRVHVARFNGSDAANVHVIARTKTDSHEYRRYYRSLANEQGVALFPGLPPGPYRLSTSRSTQSKSNAIEVLPGEQTEQSLTLAQGLRVHGQVRDSNSEAIAGASIWLTSWGLGWASGSIAAQSDAQGNYELHDVPDGQSIGASADGFHPSSLVDLDMVSNATQDRKVDLVISSGGSSLRGTVRDDAGHPIQFARIAVGNGSALPDMRLDESLRETWAPRSEQTDAKGEYSLVGLPSGNQPIQVRALGYALWNGSMDLQVGVQSTLDITLSKGCTLSGTVSDPDGKPIVKAKVLAFFEPLPEGYLQSGQIEYDGVFACPATYTDEAGHYNLPHVSDGQVYLYAQRPPVDPMDYTEIRLYAKAQMDLTEKTAATWNAVVSKGLSIEGHIYYADDVPITGVHVLLEGSPGSEARVTRSTDGSFLFTQLEDKPYTVRVAMWDLEQGQKQPELRDVRPGSAPLVIVADFNSPKEIVPANGQLRLIDAGHRIQGEPSIRLRSKGHNGRASGRLENGVWNFKIEKPGKYQAVAYSDARIIAVGEEFTIESGEVRTLPDLVTIAGGTLILEIQKPKTPFPTGLRGWIRIGPSRSSPHEAFELDFASELRIENLEPGEGILQILGDNVQEAEIPIAIMPGVETRLVVPLVSAVPVPFHIEWPASEASGPLTTRFLDRTSGSIIREFNYEDISLIRSPVDWSIPMPLGSFRLEVIKAGEPYYSEDFEVTSLEPGRAPKLGLTK